MVIALVAVAAFLVPVAVGGFAAWYGTGGLYQSWTMMAAIVVAVMVIAVQPLPATAAGLSMLAAGVSWWWSPRLAGRVPWWVRRRPARGHDREMQAFKREIAAGADADLVGRIWNAPRPRTPRGSSRDV